MREIKFRQPRFTPRGWHFIDFFYWGWMSDGHFVSPLFMGQNVKDERGQEFTGLHDKNGKEIYEGDIFKDNNWLDEEDEPVMDEVVFEDGAFTCDAYGNIGELDLGEIEVVGNIYENPRMN